MKDVPYIVFDFELTRMERTAKRLWLGIVISLLVTIGTNMLWLLRFLH